jgi:hypothetical protein
MVIIVQKNLIMSLLCFMLFATGAVSSALLSQQESRIIDGINGNNMLVTTTEYFKANTSMPVSRIEVFSDMVYINDPDVPHYSPRIHSISIMGALYPEVTKQLDQFMKSNMLPINLLSIYSSVSSYDDFTETAECIAGYIRTKKINCVFAPECLAEQVENRLPHLHKQETHLVQQMNSIYPPDVTQGSEDISEPKKSIVY